MQFLKILLLVLLAFIAAMFTLGNWSWVAINLWGGLVAEVNLPFLLLVTFLAGMVPTWAYYRTIRWRLSQRLAASERVIADLKPVVPMGSVPVQQPAPGIAVQAQAPAEDRSALPIGAAEPDAVTDPKSRARAKGKAAEPDTPAATETPSEPFTLTP